MTPTTHTRPSTPVNNPTDHNYSDIINRPRPTSRRHAPLSPQSRAAQFAPFAALAS